MKWIKGDIWDYYDPAYDSKGTTVIPTNIGWKKDGKNPMGAGLAKKVSSILKKEFDFDLPLFYGQCCQAGLVRVYLPSYDLVLVPTKALSLESPSLSWQADASPLTIEVSLHWLQSVSHTLLKPIYVPILGAGCGNLEKDDMKALMNKMLISDSFIGVEK